MNFPELNLIPPLEGVNVPTVSAIKRKKSWNRGVQFLQKFVEYSEE